MPRWYTKGGFIVAAKFEDLNYNLRNMQFPISFKEMKDISSDLSWSDRNYLKHIVGTMENNGD